MCVLFQVFNCVVNNDGAKGSAICVISAPWLRVGNTQILSGTAGVHAVESSVLIADSTVSSFPSIQVFFPQQLIHMYLSAVP